MNSISTHSSKLTVATATQSLAFAPIYAIHEQQNLIKLMRSEPHTFT